MRRPHQPADNVSFGMELVLDIAGCNIDVITDPASLRQYAKELVYQIGMKAYGDLWLHHFGHASPATTGYTLIQPIETSSIVLHASEGLRTVHINIFSCRLFDADRAMDYSEQFFCGTDTTYSVLSR